MELLDVMVEAGWDARVRRSPATPQRPHGKVLRWEATAPDGTTWSERTGPALVARMDQWAGEHLGAVSADSETGVPIIRAQVVRRSARSVLPAATAGNPLRDEAARCYVGNLGRAGSQRKPVRYDPLVKYSEHRVGLVALRDEVDGLRAATERGDSPANLEARSREVSRLCARLWSEGVPLLALGAVVGVAHSSIRNRIVRHHSVHGHVGGFPVR